MKKNKIVGAMLSLLMIMTMLACGEESYRIVKLMEKEGTVTYTRDEEIADVYENMNFENGDSVATAEESSAKLSLDADKFLTMGANTSIQMVAEGNETDSLTTITLNQGEISCEIQNALSANSLYEVKTSNATIGVHGTIFYVKAGEDRTIVYCENGEVEVTSGALTQTLLPSEAVIVEKGTITETSIENILDEVSDVAGTVLTKLAQMKEDLLTEITDDTNGADNVLSEDIEIPEGATLDMYEDGTYYFRYADGSYEYYGYTGDMVDEYKKGTYDGTEYWIRTTYYILVPNSEPVPSMRTYFDIENQAQVFRNDFVYTSLDETHYSAQKYIYYIGDQSTQTVGEPVTLEYISDADGNWILNLSKEDFFE